jgi:histidinol-phosphate aminotransferase
MSLVIPTIEQLAPYEAGKPLETLERELGVKNAIKLASNENPLGPSPHALKAITNAMQDIHRYPDSAAWALRERLAAHLHVPMSEIIHGNGSSEVLELSLRTFVGPGHHVVFADPSFVMYRAMCLAAGVPFTAVPLRDLTHDLQAMAAAVTEKTRLIFIANPNNPTGTHVASNTMEQLLRRVPEQVIIVVDEAYIEYADAPDFPDTLTMRHLRERLIVARTFSKIYGLAAQRIGYGCGPSHLIDYMNRIRPPFNVATLGQVAALAALDDVEHVHASQELNRNERRRLCHALPALGLKVAPSQANFVYVECPRPARPIYEALLRRGVIVRPVSSPNALRITVGLPAENDRLLVALQEVLAG